MFNSFPRECGPPRKIVNNIDEFLSYINNHNGKKKAVYTSVYKCDIIEGKANFDNIIIDKLFFDFDDKSCDAYNECNLFHNLLLLKGIKHIIVMSGRGYHLYVLTNPYKAKNIKATIYNAQMSFVDELKLHCDRQIIGNHAQLARVPNTYHIKAQKFCIPLLKAQFEKGDKDIKQLASKQNFVKDFVIGSKLFDIQKFDCDIKKEDDFEIEIENKNSEIEDYKTNLPECIKRCLLKKDMGWKERYLVILYFKEMGYTKQEVADILKNHLSLSKYKHCIFDERQLQYLFERDDLIFPKCEKIMSDGLCKKKCEKYNSVIYK